MAAEARKLVFLTGAPESDSLTWHEQDLLPSFASPVRRFLGEVVTNQTGPHTQLSHPLAKWRALPLSSTCARNHDRNANCEPTKFLSLQNSGHGAGDDPSHVDYLEHSLAVLQELDSSQIDLPGGLRADETTESSSMSYETELSTDLSLQASADFFATRSTESPTQQNVTFRGPYTDLNQIPNARHVRAIQPQTMTVNILAAVISVQLPRTVRLRKRAGEMDVVEVMVGDETHAGLNIAFWITPVDGQVTSHVLGTNGLRETLGKLRAGDVLLVTHMALAEFNGNVSGQSLTNRRIAKINTTVTVLSSEVIVDLPAPVTAKLNRVREWAKTFVGQPSKRPASPHDLDAKRRRRTLDLPPDTPL